MRIEDSVAFFSINLIGENSKQTYMGEFQVKCLLSPLEIIKVDKLYRSLLGERLEYAKKNTLNFAFAFAQLQYRIMKAPPFWENKEIGGGHIIDFNIISEVLERAIEAEELYRIEKIKEAEEIENRLKNAIQSGKIKKTEETEEDKEDVTEL